MHKKKTAVEVYLSTVFKWGLIILVSACMCATVTFNTEKIFGLYPTVPWIATIGLGIMDLIFFAIAILIVKTSFDETGFLKEGRLKVGKIFSVVVLVIQWNYLLYMLPTRTFWGFLFFFLILIAFFLDVKMLLGSGLICMISLFIGWFVKGTDLMPVKDDLFITDILICLIALVLSLAGLIIFVFFVAHFLVNAKKDELEKNNEHISSILSAVQELSKRLYTAGTTLSEISGNESASAEELAATSQQLVAGSNLLSAKTDESMDNLNQLKKWESVVAENVEKVEDTSQNLLNKSIQNEKLLNDLSEINNEVSVSMNATTGITQKLSEPVKEIGATLGVNTTFYQGFFLAPTVVAGALKGAIFAANIYERLGFKCVPNATESRHDIIQAVEFGTPEGMIAFFKGIQAAAPVDSYFEPEPWAMPGYDSDVIMAAGAFVQGSSIELSADGPVRPPYAAYFQGGLTWAHAKFGILKSLQSLIDAGIVMKEELIL